MTAVRCYVRKARFFLCRQRPGMTHRYTQHCSRVSVLSREILFSFLFSDPIIIGLREAFPCFPNPSLKSGSTRLAIMWRPIVLREVLSSAEHGEVCNHAL